MYTNPITKLRRLAVVAVLGNFGVIALLAWTLPREAQVLLPVVALILPLLTAAVLDGSKPQARDERGIRLRTSGEVRALRRPLEQAA